MYINKLHLRAFGKFLYKRLYLENKFNIIYGENEAGKSTVHNFIEAIFYGFDQDEEGIVRCNKFKPWDSNLYKGSINLKDVSGEKYNISKDFLLGTTQVFKKQDEESGIDEIDIECPGEYFFNMNKISFSNTVSVRQLGNKTEKELVEELKNKIINLSMTREETISIDRILQRLNSIKDEAGDENNYKTLLGQYSLRLAELKSSRENSIIAKRQVMFLAMEMKKIKSKIQELNFRIGELNKELLEHESSLDKDKYLRAEPIKIEIDEINEMLKNYNKESLKNYSDSDYKEALNIEGALNSMYSQRRNLDKLKEEKEEELENLKSDISNKITEQFNIDRLNMEYRKYKNNIEKLKDLQQKINTGKESISNINIEDINNFFESYRKIEDINRKIEITNVFLESQDYEAMKKYRSSCISSVTGLLFLAAALTLGVWWASFRYKDLIKSFIDQYYVVPESVNILAGAVTALMVLLFVFMVKPLLNKIKSSKNEIDSMECEYADHTISLNMLNEEKHEIIEYIDCESFDNLVEKFNKQNTEKSLYEEKNKLINYDIEAMNTLEQDNSEIKNSLMKSLAALGMQGINTENIQVINEAYSRKDLIREEISSLNDNIGQLAQNIVKLDKEISFEERRLSMILSSNNMDDLDSFKKATQYNEKYTELINNKNYKEGILNKILGDESFEDLNNKTKAINHYEVKKIDKQEHQLNIFKLSDEKSRLGDNISNILKEIDEIEQSTRSLAEIEEEIDFYDNKINTFKRKVKVAQIAADKIIKISDSIKGDFMPLLRKSISDNFAYLTNGKYSEVVIDEDMNIAVVESDNKQRNIELESLSGGTLDQLYLSLRVGLGNILSCNQNVPLIFDDSFVQYDSKRLKNSVEMLARESERRQVILFTCQEREVELAKQMNIKFNYIKL
ncbi:MAG: AAA family ATPase [Sedimentibacter sp.]